ncbi:MAG: AmmeMemoRadiSam system protein B [Anaerolineales bacterium]|jgi:AmmeMemoRadiSam system protein B
MEDIRPSPIAGTWYPGDLKTLASSIDQYLRAADCAQIDGEIIGIITPHAGHRYSGPVAAHAFRCLEGLEPEVVAVLSPLHNPYPAKILTSAHTAYATPLGTIEIDAERMNQLEDDLLNSWGIEIQHVRHDQEHSLEIELPFAQRCFHHAFKLLPIMLRDQSEVTAKAVGTSLANTLRGASSIIIGSSDLSHFYSQQIAERLDEEILARIGRFDPSGVIAADEEGVGFACGRGAIAATLWASRELGADRAKIVDYATSGDATGDYHSVVGYGAAVIYRRAKPS